MKATRPHKFYRLLPLALAVVLNTAVAAPRPEYASFESVCAVVQLETNPDLQALFVNEELEYDLAQSVSGYLASQGMGYPVERGSACFPRNVSTTSKQLSLVFHVTLTDQLPPAAVTGAVIVHTVFGLDLHLPHDYPTSLFTCVGGDDLRRCVSGSLADYFTRTIVPLIETGQAQRR